MSSVSKIVVLVVVVVVVLHGQNCVFNENCLYKAILKSAYSNLCLFSLGAIPGSPEPYQ